MAQRFHVFVQHVYDVRCGECFRDLRREVEPRIQRYPFESGEIYVVVAHAADDFHVVPILWAAVAALLILWPLLLLTSWSTATVLVVQPIVFVAGAAVASRPRLHLLMLPGPMTQAATRRAAYAQFLAHSVHLTEARTWVLIYVALRERRVEIVADEHLRQSRSAGLG